MSQFDDMARRALERATRVKVQGKPLRANLRPKSATDTHVSRNCDGNSVATGDAHKA